jgi:hypothetical protein
MIIELALTAAMLQAGTVKNPRTVEFTCQDHDRDDQHELDIIRVADGAVIQTLQLGDPAVDTDGKVRTVINVQPIAFGEYKARVRAVVGTLKSDDSADSNTFERVPGAPSGATVK